VEEATVDPTKRVTRGIERLWASRLLAAMLTCVMGVLFIIAGSAMTRDTIASTRRSRSTEGRVVGVESVSEPGDQRKALLPRQPVEDEVAATINGGWNGMWVTSLRAWALRSWADRRRAAIDEESVVQLARDRPLDVLPDVELPCSNGSWPGARVPPVGDRTRGAGLCA
jgi:hypothetical protein